MNKTMSEAAIKQTIRSTEAALKEPSPPKKPTEYERVQKIDLKNPALAGFLSWLVPGCGQLYQGRTAKGILFFLCVVPTFLVGCYFGSDSEFGIARNVYYSWRPGNNRLEFIAQACLGMAALPAGLQAWQLKPAEQAATAPLGSFMAPPQLYKGDTTGIAPTQTEIVVRLHLFYDFGAILTVIAGLMNLLVIFDAVDGPVVYRKDEESAKDVPK